MKRFLIAMSLIGCGSPESNVEPANVEPASVDAANVDAGDFDACDIDACADGMDAGPREDGAVVLPRDAGPSSDVVVPPVRPGDCDGFDALTPGTWCSVRTSIDFGPYAELDGRYQLRAWGNMVYAPGRGSLMFWEGYGPTAHGTYCIYGNGLYEADLDERVVHLRALTNWECDSGPPTPLPENATHPTPRDRHVYNQATYLEETGSWYVAAGASGSGNHPHDFWSYDLATAAWSELSAAPSIVGREGWELSHSGHLLPIPNRSELWFMPSSARVIEMYDVRTAAWRSVDTTWPEHVGQHGLYDEGRNRFAAFGAAVDLGVSSNHFVFLDLETMAWTRVPQTGTWPGERGYASLVYAEAADLYVLHAGQGLHDTWIYDPRASTWSEVPSDGLPDSSTGTYVSYDASRDIVVRLDENPNEADIRDGVLTFWVLRVARE